MNAKGTDQDTQQTGGLSEFERAALKERAAELKKEASRPKGGKKAAEELDVITKIAEMDPADRPVAERIHALVTAGAPDLAPKLWYGQPAYARQGKVVCFFRSGKADGDRYSTFGFTPEANLDDEGGLWPSSFAVTELTPQAEERITALVKQAMS